MRFSRAVFSCYIFEGYGQTESTSATSVSHPVVCSLLLSKIYSKHMLSYSSIYCMSYHYEWKIMMKNEFFTYNDNT